MSHSRIKSASKHKSNVATKAKREYPFFDIAVISVPSSPDKKTGKAINNFLLAVDKTFCQPIVNLI